MQKVYKKRTKVHVSWQLGTKWISALLMQQSDSGAHFFVHALKRKSDTLNTQWVSILMCFGERNSIDICAKFHHCLFILKLYNKTKDSCNYESACIYLVPFQCVAVRWTQTVPSHTDTLTHPRLLNELQTNNSALAVSCSLIRVLVLVQSWSEAAYACWPSLARRAGTSEFKLVSMVHNCLQHKAARYLMD